MNFNNVLYLTHSTQSIIISIPNQNQNRYQNYLIFFVLSVKPDMYFTLAAYLNSDSVFQVLNSLMGRVAPTLDGMAPDRESKIEPLLAHTLKPTTHCLKTH